MKSPAESYVPSLLLMLMLFIGIGRVCAQTDAQLSQYYEVPSYYNPAAIGNTDMVRIRLGSRLQ